MHRDINKHHAIALKLMKPFCIALAAVGLLMSLATAVDHLFGMGWGWELIGVPGGVGLALWVWFVYWAAKVFVGAD
ncbi:MAG TPA: hypothetical protein VJ798_11000 [Rhizomicrobium sp.]|nr:hypothetical protein [Rhizomicrobium sp.]